MMHSNTGHCMSPQIWHNIQRDVSEISIVSSWALTVVFHCEYQPRRWWIRPHLDTNSYIPLVMSEPLCAFMLPYECVCCWIYSCRTERLPVKPCGTGLSDNEWIATMIILKVKSLCRAWHIFCSSRFIKGEVGLLKWSSVQQRFYSSLK